MKKVLLVFGALVALAIVAVTLAIFFSRSGPGAGKGSSAGGPTVLVWTIDGSLPDRANPALPFAGDGATSSLEKVLPILESARRDPTVRGLAVRIGSPSFGIGRADEVRRQILAFRKAGKPVECYGETFGEGSNGTLAYFLASACDTIHLSPAGDLNLLGLNSEGRYYRGSLDRLHVSPQFLRSGRYKSAVETYTRSDASPSSTEALGAVLDGYYDQIVQGIADQRKISPARVRALFDGAPYSAREALALKLVDRLSYPDQLLDSFKLRLHRRPKRVDLEDYSASSSFGSGHRIAVVIAQGTIVRGSENAGPFGGESLIASDDLIATLDDLRDDDSYDAVVLRVDSPGGSALASDLILHAVVRLKEKKPVVASFSEIAASGGYYIASRASRIVSEPGTLTGSIGVFGGKFVTRELESQLLGIGHSTQKRGANADIYSPLHDYTPEQEVHLQAMMDGVYRTFLGHVAGGRKMKVEAVEAIASGRIWTGEEAKRRGLVDELGGLERAIAVAKDAAKIPADSQAAIDYLPRERSFFELLFRRPPTHLPAALERLTEVLEPHVAGVLQLPPDLERLSRPF